MSGNELEVERLVEVAVVVQAQLIEAEAADRSGSTDVTRLRLSVAVKRLQDIKQRLVELGVRDSRQ